MAPTKTLRQGARSFFIQIKNGDAGTLGCEKRCRGQTNSSPARGTGNDGGFAV
jgi:hypothetical protein